ncbi:cell division protein ZapD [Candidatus Venteria ishoeyi]|uniref:Cell division protein ZapD n=1 Tax=Candidatus Venteria ishoeyi TaxID=1899563 RepID=A0A1H6F8T2_9GAMM|nr:cell division protein ZapD [Candidatus Venteria ishoeyi]MDM8547196.1 cell division protein ZapD [Candidatus Venteria ishoeyi]SEH06537.1 Cell division protein ZapD [Candidatus Venteria ishoeyi]
MALAHTDSFHTEAFGEAENSNLSKQALVKHKIIYEQPLNERIRGWLRLEHLFQCVTHRMNGLSSWDSRIALEGIVKILDFVSRNDLKPDLIKDLETHIQTLKQWQKIPQVDTERLQQLLDKLLMIKNAVIALEGTFAAVLNQHHLLSSVRQRSGIPGGTCQFDLPAYYYWSRKRSKQRQHDLQEWLNAFEPLREANALNLYLTRQNVQASQEIAAEGFFQSKPETQKPCQMIRVILSEDSPCYPEISGSKHRFNLRFFEHQQLRDKPVQTIKNIPFELHCCGFM